MDNTNRCIVELLSFSHLAVTELNGFLFNSYSMQYYTGSVHEINIRLSINCSSCNG